MDWNTITGRMEELYAARYQIHLQIVDFWKEHILFSWRWWLMAAMAVLPWAIWLMVRKKESTDRLMYAGLFIALLASVLDGFGVSLRLWSYPVSLLPLIPQALPLNVCVLPVVTMLFLQFFPKVKPVWKGLVYAASGGFLFEQILEWLGLYHDSGWRHIFSFVLLLLIYLLADRLARGRNFDPIDR